MPKTKKNDFIEIEFTGKIKETNQIFDLTDEELARQNKIHNPNAAYGPVIICLGQNDVIPGLDEQLQKKELNKTYNIDIEPEKAFGKKDPKLMKLVPFSVFKKQNIRPFPGLQININNMIGVIRTVSGGRIIVDFNHPLAGRTLTYQLKINKIITDTKQKLNATLTLHIKNPKFEIKNSTAQIHNIPEQIQEIYKKRILETIPEIKKIEFLPKPPSDLKNNKQLDKEKNPEKTKQPVKKEITKKQKAPDKELKKQEKNQKPVANQKPLANNQ